jgi:predicted lipoprotein with Yx(FWY)xxD motif
MCNRSYGSAVLISMASYQGESCKTGMHSQASLLDIVRAAQSILAFVSGMTLDNFTADVKTQSAVLYQIAIIWRSG